MYVFVFIYVYIILYTYKHIQMCYLIFPSDLHCNFKNNFLNLYGGSTAISA